ncbi:maleylpyruvate isomerase family mycothiol-dependent enzyme [Paractinoplanes atraurantiacus]|uniref:TIGR03083 family protein n=1 Tax=Paractinoplanes atraurantiacus TaxID=1036182 RepID=A0A285KDN2_9ACTN|nr:maleylpyruvate isomerase family mycothiol-dependent enzyme [Actinoplanes atraurantiacus]SNY70715.1 TIGR03083 family protein [Actinoplanes atraurantiacus]
MWDVIVAERLALADLLDSLSPEEWGRPSLCRSWTVHDVAAHMTMQQLGLAGLVGVAMRWRGSMARTTREAARRRAADRAPAQIVAEIRETAPRHRHTVGVSRLETLTDLLVHTQDIAVPLGRRHDMPPKAAAVAATRMLTMRWPPPLPSARAAAGFRLTATDTDWTWGSGLGVQGPMSALLLTCCGRDVARSELSGPGAPDLIARLSR